MTISNSHEFLRRLIEFLNNENSRAEAEAAPFLNSPDTEWPHEANLGYGALHHLLDVAHAELDRDAHRAIALTRLVLAYAPNVDIPVECDVYRRHLLGRAWKEHGNALHACGQLKDAVIAARCAAEVLTTDALLSERMAAYLLEAIVMHELGEAEEAGRLLKECRESFTRLGETRRLLQVDITEGGIMYGAGHYENAKRKFLAAQKIAEQLLDNRELARLYNNLGYCEIQLEHSKEAVGYFYKALLAFEREGMAAEGQRVVSGLASLFRKTGDFDTAIVLFQNARDEFLRRGMVIEAAEAELSLLEVMDVNGASEQVTRIARELVAVFSNAGMQRNLRRALAYLAEQAHPKPSAAFGDAVRHVRGFLRKLADEPEATFLPPASRFPT